MSRLSGRSRALVLAAAGLLVAGLALVWAERRPELSKSVPVVMPTSGELAAFGRARVFFGHQSVGANIVDGVELVFADAAVQPTIKETRLAVPASSGFLAHSPVGVNGDPLGKFEDFVEIMDGPLGAAVDVALVKLCYVDIVATTDPVAVFEAYVEMMAKLTAAHPEVRFLYTTVPLTTDRTWKSTIRTWLQGDDQMGPPDNVVRAQYNQLVRDRFSGSGRLFDVAAVEATLDGDPMVRSLAGEPYEALNQALSSDAGHLNDLGARLAAAELVKVVAAGPSE